MEDLRNSVLFVLTLLLVVNGGHRHGTQHRWQLQLALGEWISNPSYNERMGSEMEFVYAKRNGLLFYDLSELK
jgi:hypothetical protein